MPCTPAHPQPYCSCLFWTDYKQHVFHYQKVPAGQYIICCPLPMHLPDPDLAPVCPPSYFPPLGLIISPPMSSVSIWNTLSSQIILCLFPQYLQLFKCHLEQLLPVMLPHSLLSGQEPSPLYCHTLPHPSLGQVSPPGSYISFFFFKI